MTGNDFPQTGMCVYVCVDGGYKFFITALSPGWGLVLTFLHPCWDIPAWPQCSSFNIPMLGKLGMSKKQRERGGGGGELAQGEIERLD